MRTTIVLLPLSLLLLSCSGESLGEKVSEMFTCLEKADSLCKAGQTIEARVLLNNVLNEKVTIDDPSVLEKLINLIDSDYDPEKEEGLAYYGYLFSCLAQLDALDMLYSLADGPQERINVLKRLFDLFPDIDNVFEKYTEWMVKTRGLIRWSASLPYDSLYDAYIDKVKPDYMSKVSAKQLPKVLYRRKWRDIDRLLIESDKEYGYDATFSFLESVLTSHGASVEEFTKCLVKAYMSFSGDSNYHYESGMDYQTFKNIAANQECWFVTWIENPEINFNAEETVFPPEREGFIIEYDNCLVYNPSLIMHVDGFGILPHKLTVMNGLNKTALELLKGHKYAFSTTQINIDKPLLCALLYKYDYAAIIPEVLDARQLSKQDTLLREGHEGGCKKVVLYDDSFNEIEWRLYSEQGSPVCDSEGTHIQRTSYYNDSTVYYYYGNDSLPRKKDYARMKTEKDNDSYYDWQDNLVARLSGDTLVYFYYKYSDSIVTTIANNYETNNCIVTTEHKSASSPVLLKKPYKEIFLYSGLYDNATDTQHGNLMEIHRFTKEGYYYEGADKWAMEKFGYDSQDRILWHAFYDSQMILQGGMNYVYMFNSVEIQYIDKDRNVTKKEVKYP